MALNDTMTIPQDAKWPDPVSLVLEYDRKGDVLYLLPHDPMPAVSVDVDGEAWVRYVPDTNEIVGLKIEDFERVFLKRHPELAGLWAEVNGRRFRLFHRERTELGTFLNVVVNWLRQCFSNSSPRMSPSA